MRDIFRGIICVVLLSLTLMAPSQELVVPFPQGEGYSLKKDAPSPETKWALKIVRPSGPLGASESIIVSPESFYYFYEAPGPPEEAAPGAVATPLPSFGERLKTDPIERYINPPVYEEGRLEGRAFFEAYGDVLKLAPQDEPIELVIGWAAWQFWYNQVLLWEQYVGKKIFLKSTVPSSVENLDFSSQVALNNSVATLGNEKNSEAKSVSEEEHTKNLAYISRLALRENQRNDYRQWLKDQKVLVDEFTRDWAKKQQGLELTIEGTVYLLSREPLARVPRNAVNLVTEKLTPYDLINNDGTLKKPAE